MLQVSNHPQLQNTVSSGVFVPDPPDSYHDNNPNPPVIEPRLTDYEPRYFQQKSHRLYSREDDRLNSLRRRLVHQAFCRGQQLLQ